MKITVKKEVSLGALLREVMEKRTGVIRMSGYDRFDRPTETGIDDATYEKVAEEFYALTREGGR